LSINIKEIRRGFYRLYSNPVLSDNDISKPMQKKIAKFRNEMAVDFYNLTKKDVPEFAKKYLPDGVELFLDKPIEEYLFNDLGQSGFKIVLDQVLAGEHITDEGIKYIEHNLYGFIHQVWDQEAQRWHMEAYKPEQISQILRATCEFLYLLSNDEVEVGRCGADDCTKIFVKNNPGSEQLYCSKTCKMREYRRRQKVAI